jgi:hypothetical protein
MHNNEIDVFLYRYVRRLVMLFYRLLSRAITILMFTTSRVLLSGSYWDDELTLPPLMTQSLARGCEAAMMVCTPLLAISCSG